MAGEYRGVIRRERIATVTELAEWRGFAGSADEARAAMLAEARTLAYAPVGQPAVEVGAPEVDTIEAVVGGEAA